MATKSRKPRNAQLPAPEVLVVQDSVKLDLSLNMGDLAEMVASDARTAMLAQRGEIKHRLEEAQQTYKDQCEQLSTLSKTVIVGAEDEADVRALVAAMSAFTGTAYAAVTSEARVNVATKTVALTLAVCTAISAQQRAQARRDNRSYYGGGGTEVTREVSRPFTTEMHQMVAAMETQLKVIRDIESEMQKVNSALADLPNLISRAKAGLTRAYLANELRTGQDMLRILNTAKDPALLQLTNG